MEFTHNRTVKIIALLLFLAAITQPIYTILYYQAPDVNRHILWGLEGLLFVILSAFAGSALVTAKKYMLGFSAIAFSAVLNIVQVGVGLTQFGPFREASTANPDLGGITFSVIAFSFFSYNAAKILLGLAAVDFGMAKLKNGRKLLGGATVMAGAVAFITNSLVLIFGIDGFFPRPVAGATGVVATLLLALCLFGITQDEDT